MKGLSVLRLAVSQPPHFYWQSAGPLHAYALLTDRASRFTGRGHSNADPCVYGTFLLDSIIVSTCLIALGSPRAIRNMVDRPQEPPAGDKAPLGVACDMAVACAFP